MQNDSEKIELHDRRRVPPRPVVLLVFMVLLAASGFGWAMLQAHSLPMQVSAKGGR